MSHTGQKKKKGAGLAHMSFTKKDMRRAGSFHPSPKNTQQQDPRNACRHYITMEGLCDQENIKHNGINLCLFSYQLNGDLTWGTASSEADATWLFFQ